MIISEGARMGSTKEKDRCTPGVREWPVRTERGAGRAC